MKVYYSVSNKVEDFNGDKFGKLDFVSVPKIGEYVYMQEFEFCVEGVWYEFSKDYNAHMPHINLR